MTKCEVCGKEVLMPFKCPYCGGYFCAEHRLPEKHNCPGLYAAASPYEKEWKERMRAIRLEEEQRILAKKRVARTEILHLTAGALIVMLAGPLSNIILSAIFYIGSHIFLKIIWIGWLHYVLGVLASLNAFIAFFNLLPFGALDGRKIIAWSPARWATAFAVSIILLILGYVA